MRWATWTPTSASGAEPASIQSASRACTVAEHAVPRGAERLEDRAVEDVGADRDLGVEVEEQDQDRRHQRAAAHAGHADEHTDEQRPPARTARSRLEVSSAGSPGIGHETNGLPVTRQSSLYASQPVQKPVAAASSASAATSRPSAAPRIVDAERVRDRGRREDGEPDHVRGARRARVLELALAEPRLDELEVGDARACTSAGRASARARAGARAARAATTSRSRRRAPRRRR